MVKDLEEAPPEVQAEVKTAIRTAIREGKIRFSSVARKQMEEKEMTEEELIGMIMKQCGLDS